MGSKTTMGVKPVIRPASKLYDEDFAVWTTQTARLLREGRFDEELRLLRRRFRPEAPDTIDLLVIKPGCFDRARLTGNIYKSL